MLVVDASCLCEVLLGGPAAEPIRNRLAIEDLEYWPAERFSHRLLLSRAWELRDIVRGWDARYVALAEAIDAVLLTTDARLAGAPGPACRIEAIEPSPCVTP